SDDVIDVAAMAATTATRMPAASKRRRIDRLARVRASCRDRPVRDDGRFPAGTFARTRAFDALDAFDAFDGGIPMRSVLSRRGAWRCA
ncbi:MAG TPA: hypothetical protein VF230_16655, partial [Acidimicrobiales bacterium]